ncbi:transposase [Streptomyces tendae]
MPRRPSLFHRNAPLTATGRLRLARCVVDDGWPLRRAAERFQVSHTTAARWTGRYREHGPAGMQDRSSRPHHQPRRTPAAIEERVVRLRREHRTGPVRLAARCNIAASTAHRILVRHHLPAPARRCPAPPAPCAAPWRGRPRRSSPARRSRTPAARSHPAAWRPARRESRHLRILPETGNSLVRRTRRDRRTGTDRQRLGLHQEHLARHLPRPGDQPALDSPLAAQTNGKVERFHRTLLDEWAYQRPYTSNAERQAAFPDWLDWYNHHQPHTGHRRPHTSQPCHQPLRTAHLGRAAPWLSGGDACATSPSGLRRGEARADWSW